MLSAAAVDHRFWRNQLPIQYCFEFRAVHMHAAVRESVLLSSCTCLDNKRAKRSPSEPMELMILRIAGFLSSPADRMT